MDKEIKDLEGKDIGRKIGETVSKMLVTENREDPVGAYSLAISITKVEAKLNDSDIAYIQNAVEKTKTYNFLVVGQVVIELESMKSNKD